MRCSYALVITLALPCLLAIAVRAQDQLQPSQSGRRVVVQVAPQYPMAAKRMRLGGTVKVVATVGSDGKVARVEPVGGSPILVQAAQTAVVQWRYVPGPESQESVELHFTP
jgi:TonB family protein